MREIMNNETMTSLKVAEIAEITHANLMKAIRKMEESWVQLGQVNFYLTYYKDRSNRNSPMYELTKKECLYVATKFSDLARGKLILRWEELEIKAANPMLSLSRAEMFKLAYETELQLEQVKDENRLLESQLEVVAPKAEVADRLLNCDELLDMGQAAKALQLPYGRNKLFRKLRDMGILFKYRNEPKQYMISQGYMKIKEKIWNNGGKDHVSIQVFVTQKGLQYLSKRINGAFTNNTPQIA